MNNINIFVKNTNMRKLIKLFYEIKKVKDIVEPSILAASLTYYFLIIITPFFTLLTIIENSIKNQFIDSFNGGLSFFVFLISLIYVSSKFVYSFQLVMKKIYQIEVELRFVSRIKAFLFMFILLLIIFSEFILELFINYLLNKIIGFLKIITILLSFIIRIMLIAGFIGFILKKLLPIKIKIRYAYVLSIIYTLLSYLVILIYKSFYNYFGVFKFEKTYGILYKFVLLMILIYALFNIFIYLLIIFNHMYKTKKIE